MNKTAELLSIREVAKRTGLTSRTLRYYEEKGLLRSEKTYKGSIRCYDHSCLTKIKRIKELKEFLGFSLDDIKLFVHVEECCPDFMKKYESLMDPEEKKAMLKEGLEELTQVQEIAYMKLQGIQRLLEGFDRKRDLLTNQLTQLNGEGRC